MDGFLSLDGLFCMGVWCFLGWFFLHVWCFLFLRFLSLRFLFVFVSSCVVGFFVLSCVSCVFCLGFSFGSLVVF